MHRNSSNPLLTANIHTIRENEKEDDEDDEGLGNYETLLNEEEPTAQHQQHHHAPNNKNNKVENEEDVVDYSDENSPLNGRLLSDDEDYRKDWFVENDLDVFFSRLYYYYRFRGFGSIIATNLNEIVTTGFTLFFSTFLIVCVDWNKLHYCAMLDLKLQQNRTETSISTANCTWLGEFVFNPLYESPGNDPIPFLRRLVMFGFVLFFSYWCVLVLRMFAKINQARQTRNFYRHKLKLTTRELLTVEWSTVVSRLIALRGVVNVQINDAPLTALAIANRIMRKENYLIAMINQEVLPLGSPSWSESFAFILPKKVTQFAKMEPVRKTNVWWMSKCLEYNLNLVIFTSSMFDERTFRLSASMNDDVNIEMRFKIMALINLVLLPFTLGFTAIFFFLQYAEEFHSKKNYLGPRFWTPHALWTLREFNELPHLFDRRTVGSLRHAERYLRMFPTPVPGIIARMFAFVLGALLAILLLAFAIIDESVLLNVRWGNKNLVWYAAYVSAGLAVVRAFVPAPDEEVVTFSPNAQFRRIVAFSHYNPPSWRNKAHTFVVRDGFASLFPYRVEMLFRELLSVVCTPYVLYFVLAPRSNLIASFLRDNTTFREGLGDVCSYSLMRLNKPGRNMLALQESLMKDSVRVTFDTKLERSWLAFRINYDVANAGIRDDVGEDLYKKVLDYSKATGGGGNFNNNNNNPWGVNSSVMLNAELTLQKHSNTTLGIKNEVEDPVGAGAGEDYFFWLEEFLENERKKKEEDVV